jgi:hypothetical protein
MTREGIGSIVSYVCRDVRGIGEVRPTVKGGSRGLEIDCVTTLEPRFNPVEVGRRLRSHIKGRVEEAIGVPVREVVVHVRPRSGTGAH